MYAHQPENSETTTMSSSYSQGRRSWSTQKVPSVEASYSGMTYWRQHRDYSLQRSLLKQLSKLGSKFANKIGNSYRDSASQHLVTSNQQHPMLKETLTGLWHYDIVTQTYTFLNYYLDMFSRIVYSLGKNQINTVYLTQPHNIYCVCLYLTRPTTSTMCIYITHRPITSTVCLHLTAPLQLYLIIPAILHLPYLPPSCYKWITANPVVVVQFPSYSEETCRPTDP